MEATVIDPDVVIFFWQDQTAGRASSNRFLLCSGKNSFSGDFWLVFVVIVLKSTT